MNIAKPKNLYSSLKEIISDREILLSINSFKSAEGGNSNNNNNTVDNINTAVNRERIDTNLSEIYILPKGSKQERRA